MRDNHFYTVTSPFVLYLNVGYTDSNTYVGASQMLGNVWQRAEATPAAQLHRLVGGDFYVTEQATWECKVELSEKHPFEKVYLLREPPWPMDKLQEIPEAQALPRNRVDPLTHKYSSEQLDQAGASRFGRGIDYVIPQEQP